MSEDTILRDGMIRKNIETSIKRGAKSYKYLIFIFIALLGGAAYINYLQDPEFFIKPTLFVAIIFAPFIIFAIVSMVKNKKYSMDFETHPKYLGLKERFNLKDLNDFDAFDSKISKEYKENKLFEDKALNVVGTDSYIIEGKLSTLNFSVYDASKLLLVVFKPKKITETLVLLAFKKRRSNYIALYFEDHVTAIEVLSKKNGRELTNKIASTYKVISGVDENLVGFYDTDRDKFIEICRAEARKVYGNTPAYK
ncbi:hypothetical protein [Desnuesiella massiliensis]|uniref:hypothetical protein n=1 Tax=Desnuesiella massiliensis TaxID=1650662 RepID=UPI0006E247C0|nr:hypothetical protein [Desnuesiella massiliensis]